MTPTKTATHAAVVLPLQRPQVQLDIYTLPFREHPRVPEGRYRADLPAPEDHAYWDAEAEGTFLGISEQHGRRCGCTLCTPPAAAEAAS